LTPRQTVSVLYLVTGILSAGALMISGVGRFPIIVILGMLLAALSFGARRTGLLTPAAPSAAGAAAARAAVSGVAVPAAESVAAPAAVEAAARTESPLSAQPGSAPAGVRTELDGLDLGPRAR
jgi:hypothetical protein